MVHIVSTFAAGPGVSAVPPAEATAGVSGGGASVHSDAGVATGRAFTGGFVRM